jgi:hypothetical protein
VSTLHKIYLCIVAVLVLGCGLAAHLYHTAQVRAEVQQSATEQVIAAKNQALADRDKIFNDFKLQMLQQIADIKTAKQAVTVLQPVVSQAGQIAPQQVSKSDLPAEVQKQLPGAANTNYTLLSDSQMVLLGQREKSCQLTESGLTKCEADRQDYIAQITALTKANKDWEKAGAVGPWTILAGAAKSNGTGNGWTPAILVNRRLGPKLGLWAGAENRAVLGGVSFNLGGPK